LKVFPFLVCLFQKEPIMKLHRFVFAAALLAVFGFCAAAQADIWNMADDIHASMVGGTPTNSNGAWTYGRTDAVGGAFTANPVLTDTAAWWGPGAVAGWCYTGNPFLPGIWSVMSDQPAGALGAVAVNTGDMLVHPGFASDCAVVRWTAPASGQYDVSASWESLNGIGDPYDYNHGVDVHLLVNGTSVYDGVSSYYNSTGPATLGSTILTLAAGDTLDFVTSPLGAEGFPVADVPYAADITRVNATIAAVPEPGTFVLLGSALMSVAICVWRRK
jgi:hypothetical protein